MTFPFFLLPPLSSGDTIRINFCTAVHPRVGLFCPARIYEFPGLRFQINVWSASLLQKLTDTLQIDEDFGQHISNAC